MFVYFKNFTPKELNTHKLVVRKKILFGRNFLEHIISMGLPFVPPPSALTGGSSVRGTAGPIWVRKGFNYFLSLYYRFLAKPKFVSTKYSLDSIYSIP